MKKFIVYDNTGKILRTGGCSDKDFFLQARDGEFVIEGKANDVTQKVANPGIAGRVVNKTPEEIEADNPTPKPVPFEKRPAQVTNEQWQDVLGRLKKFENHLAKIDE